MIIPSAKINFVHVPKAAGSTIGRALRKGCPLTDEDEHTASSFAAFALERHWRFPNHAPASVRLEFLGEERYREYFSFGFVRNPFDLLVSIYEYTKQTEVQLFSEKGWALNEYQNNILKYDFRSWVENCNTGKPQFEYVMSENGALLVDFIGHTENLQHDVAKISSVLGIDENSSSERVNSTSHADYQSYYDKPTRERVEKRYCKDIELFAYSFD